MKITGGTRNAWGIGHETRQGFKLRRVVWGRLLARYERRHDEKIVRVRIVAQEPKAKTRRENV